MTPCAITIAGETLIFLPQKAVYWPREKMLIVADIHFGKASSFRRLGVPVPHGTTAQNLMMLDELILRFNAESIVFLGDFLHSRNTADASLKAMLKWRAHNPLLQLTLVRGNHDLRAGDPPPEMHMLIVNEPHMLEPFAFCHHPDMVSNGYVLAGHVHPAYLLIGLNESFRLPCFVVGKTRAILPAFGAFTGGHTIAPQRDETIYVIAEESVIALPSSRG